MPLFFRCKVAFSTTRPRSGSGSMSTTDISWIDLSFSLLAPPLLHPAWSPTAENQVSRVTGTRTGSPDGCDADGRPANEHTLNRSGSQ